MSEKEFRVPFNEISNSQTITGVNIRKFKEHGLDIHKNECDVIDDHDKKQRVYKVRNVKFFDMGRGKK